MKQITADKNLVAYCGLYCGACGSYLKGCCRGGRSLVTVARAETELPPNGR